MQARPYFVPQDNNVTTNSLSMWSCLFIKGRKKKDKHTLVLLEAVGFRKDEIGLFLMLPKGKDKGTE